jgi:hypothetical protein
MSDAHRLASLSEGDRIGYANAQEESLPWIEPQIAEEEGSKPLVPRWLLVVGVLSFIALFVGLSMGVYSHITEQKPATAPVLLASTQGEDVPLIKAPQTPIKSAPSDPGGMDVPDQDKMVLGVAAGDTPPATAGPALAPSAEQPLPRPKPQTAPPVPAKEQPAPDAAPNARQPSVVNLKKNNAVLLQLGSFGSLARAQSAWAELQSTHSILQGLSADIQEAGTNKVRLRATGFQSRAQAQEICNALKEKGQGCFFP